jgi:hypothetical protein
VIARIVQQGVTDPRLMSQVSEIPE